MLRPSSALLSFLAALLLPAAASAHIKIVSPNGGETFTAGEVVTIEWCINIGHTLQNWDIWYSTDVTGTFTACDDQAGAWTGIIPNIPPTCTNGGSNFCITPANPCCMQYFWTVPNINSGTVKIRIRMDNTGTDYFDVSDDVFTIRGATSGPIPDRTYEFTLAQNEPNPFRPGTSISFVLERDSPLVRLSIYDARGALVTSLLDGPQPLGPHSVAWNGTDRSGARVTSGVYFYRLESLDRVATRKMTLLR